MTNIYSYYICLTFFLFSILLLVFSLLVLFIERKFIGIFQCRLGTTMLGRNGFLHLFADLLKFFSKETSKNIFFGNSLWNTVFMTVFGYYLWSLFSCFFYTNSIFSLIDFFDYQIFFYLFYANLSVVYLFYVSIAIKSKYAIIGGLRLLLTNVFLEFFFSLLFLFIFIYSGGFAFMDFFNSENIFFFFFTLPFISIFFFIYSIYEAKRAPFDYNEAESELISGLNIEFSGRTLLFFFFTEYIHLLFSIFLIFIFCFGNTEIFLSFFYFFYFDNFCNFLIFFNFEYEQTENFVENFLSKKTRLQVDLPDFKKEFTTFLFFDDNFLCKFRGDHFKLNIFYFFKDVDSYNIYFTEKQETNKQYGLLEIICVDRFGHTYSIIFNKTDYVVFNSYLAGLVEREREDWFLYMRTEVFNNFKWFFETSFSTESNFFFDCSMNRATSRYEFYPNNLLLPNRSAFMIPETRYYKFYITFFYYFWIESTLLPLIFFEDLYELSTIFEELFSYSMYFFHFIFYIVPYYFAILPWCDSLGFFHSYSKIRVWLPFSNFVTYFYYNALFENIFLRFFEFRFFKTCEKNYNQTLIEMYNPYCTFFPSLTRRILFDYGVSSSDPLISKKLVKFNEYGSLAEYELFKIKLQQVNNKSLVAGDIFVGIIDSFFKIFSFKVNYLTLATAFNQGDCSKGQCVINLDSVLSHKKLIWSCSFLIDEHFIDSVILNSLDNSNYIKTLFYEHWALNKIDIFHKPFNCHLCQDFYFFFKK